MPKLIAIAGLSGSGKTRYIDSLRDSIPGVIADDYSGRARNPDFTQSRHFVDLLRALNAGNDCLVCDISFCRAARRAEFEAVIRRSAPSVEFEWRFFANEPDLCLQNVRRRARMNVGPEERSILELAPAYEIPTAATILPVWRPPS